MTNLEKLREIGMLKRCEQNDSVVDTLFAALSPLLDIANAARRHECISLPSRCLICNACSAFDAVELP